MKKKPVFVFVILVIGFLIFSISIYLKPIQLSKYELKKNIDAANGRLVWQKYNCQACHQLYGLGGYLGPDLTNIYSKYKGDDKVMKIFFKGGRKQMPTFYLSNKEVKLLSLFLKNTDESGSADPRDYKLLKDGMIQQDENEK